MTSLRHIRPERDPRDGYLDAARDCILDVGWRRTTLTEVARRAGVSRMTIYRTWSDMPTLLGDLMTREWAGVVADAVAAEHRHHALERIADAVVGTVRALREQRAVRADRRARPRAAAALPARPARPQPGADPRPARRADRRAARPTATVRAGDPVRCSRAALVLAAHGFVLSAHTMVDDQVTEDGARRRAGHPARPRRWPRDRTTARIRRPAPRRTSPAARRRPRRRRPRRHRRRGRARRRHPRPVGARRRRPRPRVRHLALVVQAGARRAALPRHGPGRRRPRERRRARHPDGGHRPAPHPRDADAGAAHVQRRPRPRRRSPAAGFAAGDLLRRGARTAREHPAPPAPDLRHRGAGAGARRCAPPGCAAACSRWDGQLEDDARLVVTLARTAAAHGARVRTRARVLERHRDRASTLRDELTGADAHGRAPAPSSTPPASGPATWSTTSRCARAAAPTWCSAPTRCPACGSRSRRRCPAPPTASCSCCRSPTARSTSASPTSRSTGPVPDVPEPTERRDRLPARRRLGGVRPAAAPRRRGRRLRRAAAAARHRRTAPPPTCRAGTPCSPRRTGVVTVVGGKLTTYRRMAEDAVDAAVAGAGSTPARAGPAPLPLLGAAAARGRWPGSRSRPAWSGGSAPTPRWCSTTPAASPA